MISFQPMYELMVIAKSDLAQAISAKVEKFLKEAEAASVKVENLGKKTLAYAIAKQTEGEYFLYNFEAEGKNLKALSDKLRLEQEGILRHLLIKVAKVSQAKRHKGNKSATKVEVEEKKEEEVKAKPTVTVTTRAGSAKVEKEEKVAKKEPRVSKAKKTPRAKK